MKNLVNLKPYCRAYKDIEPIDLPEPSDEVKMAWQGDHKVIFFDIDETMIHCLDDRDPKTANGQYQIQIDVKDKLNDLIHDSKLDHITVDLNMRPLLMECLNELKTKFQIVTFTASDKVYADAIIDFIDPFGDIFSYRLYRQSCIETEFGLIKDLRVIRNRKMSDMIIIDNSALSFAFNVNNGIPILPYINNEEDEELKHLTFYLNCLQDQQV